MKREFARQLRRNSSKAENLLWYYLRNKQQQNIKFRRQHIMGPYIVDFVSLSTKLIVELDGGQHAEQTSYDQQRTRWLELQGYKVYRFWNNEVLGNTDSVLEIIRGYLQGKNN